MAKRTTPIDENEVHLFATAGELHAWLAKHHAKNTGVWLRIGKKNSGLVTITYDEAVGAANGTSHAAPVQPSRNRKTYWPPRAKAFYATLNAQNRYAIRPLGKDREVRGKRETTCAVRGDAGM